MSHIMQRVFLSFFLLAIAINAELRKTKIAVLPFSVSTDIIGSSQDRSNLGKILTDRTSSTVAALGRFEIVDRMQLETLLKEKSPESSGIVNDSTAVEVGKASGADLVVLGTVDHYRAEYSGEGIAAQISLSVQFIDPSSGTVKNAIQIDQSGSGSSTSEARLSAAGNSVNSIIASIKEMYPLDARIARVDPGEVTINMGSEMGIRKGQYYKVLREGSRIIDESTGEEIGTESIETALIKITSVEKDYSRAKVVKKSENIGAGDMIRETRPRTNLGISGGYSYSGATSSIGSAPVITYTTYIRYGDIDTITPDFSDFEALEKLMGFFLSIDFYQIRNTNVMTGFNFAFTNHSDKFSSFVFDFRIGYEFPVIAERLFIPIGAGLGFGSYTYKIPYIYQLQSHLTNYRTTVMESTALEEISTFTFGVTAFSGLRVKVMRHLGIFAHAGYRYHPVVSEWSAKYKTWEWDDEIWDVREVEREFEIDQKMLPHRDVQLKGLDMRIGVTYLF